MSEDCFKIIDGVTYTADMRILLECDQDREGEVVIPEGVLFIKEYAFSRCHIRSVIMPDTLRAIHSQAFVYCRNLKHVDFGNGITRIGEWLRPSNIFAGCENLKTVIIPPQVETIEGFAFASCGIEKLVLKNGIKEIKDEAFSGCRDLAELDIPESLEYFGKHEFHRISNIKMKTVPQNLIASVVMDNPFYRRPNIIRIEIAGRTVFVPGTMERENIQKVNDIFNYGKLPEEFVSHTYLYAMSNTVRNELAFRILNDAVQKGNINKTRGAKKIVKENILKIVNYFLLFGDTKNVADAIQFGFLTKAEISELLDKVSDPTLRAYLISCLPNTKENDISLQI